MSSSYQEYRSWSSTKFTDEYIAMRILASLLPLAICACALTTDGFPENRSSIASSSQDLTARSKPQDPRTHAIIRILHDHYVYPESVARAENEIRALSDKFGALDDRSYADAMRKPLSDAIRDRHLLLQYSEVPIEEDYEERAEPSDTAATERMASFAKRVNYGISDARILDGNIGYIAIDAFFAADTAAPAFEREISKLRETCALIVDLRNSRYGGEPDMVALISAYLIPRPGQLLTRTVYRSGEVVESRIPAIDPGHRYPEHRSVYVLTSKMTFSAGEELAYNLKAFERAQVIGEPTGGGANPGDTYRITSHLGLFVPEAEVFSAVDGGNWNWSGVMPDERVKPDDALEYAIAKACSK